MTKRDRERNLSQRQDFAELMKHYPFTTETLAGEEWRDVEGTSGKYQISSYGRVKSSIQGRSRILKPYLNEDCYLAVELQSQGKRIFPKIHRLVAKAFIQNPDNKPQVNHVDGIKWNACASNLEWVTQSENMRHAHDAGLIVMAKGEDVHNSKLTNEQVIYIRENLDGLTEQQLAIKFNVNQSTISNIQLGLVYRSVGGKIRTEHANLKFTHEIREEIYRLYQTGEYTQKELGKQFGTTRETIRRIIRMVDKQKIVSKEFGTSALAKSTVLIAQQS